MALQKPTNLNTISVEVYSIREAHEILDPVIRLNILLIHAGSGSDITYATYGQRKTILFKLKTNCQQLAPELVDKDKTANKVGETRQEYIPN